MNTITSTPTTRSRMKAIGAAAMVAVVVSAAVAQHSGDSAPRSQAQPPTMSAYEELRDLVNRGIVPRRALEPARLTDEEMLRDLVNHGIVPRQALEPARMSDEEMLRDLVNRGIVPRQALPD